jgi:hypothetical protein
VDASGGHAASIERIGGRGARELVWGRMHNLSLLVLIGMTLLLVYGLVGWLWG